MGLNKRILYVHKCGYPGCRLEFECEGNENNTNRMARCPFCGNFDKKDNFVKKRTVLTKNG